MSARLMMIRHWHLRNGHKPRDGQDYCEGCAHEMDDLLKHMSSAGLVVVPRELTDKMIYEALGFRDIEGRADRSLQEFWRLLLKASEGEAT